MKTTFWISKLSAAAVALSLSAGTANAYVEPPPFHDRLAPHGSWIAWEGGVQVWQPRIVHVRPDWRPYYHDGHWGWNGSAWQWHSVHPWGQVVFHYGNWWDAPGIGWVWVPGTVYAPAWVHWRYQGSYWGWAPMPPPARLHSHLSYGFRSSRSSGVSISFSLSPRHYVFVPAASFGTASLTHIGFYGTSGWVRFEHTRRVASGPSPYSVGAYQHVPCRSSVTIIEQPVYVAPPAYRHHRSPSHRYQRPSTRRHPAPSTPTRAPAPTPVPRVHPWSRTGSRAAPSARMQAIEGASRRSSPATQQPRHTAGQRPQPPSARTDTRTRRQPAAQRPAVSVPRQRAVPVPQRPAVQTPRRSAVPVPQRPAVQTPQQPAVTTPRRPPASAGQSGRMQGLRRARGR